MLRKRAWCAEAELYFKFFCVFTATVGCDADESPFAGAGGEHWEEHLLIERILQARVGQGSSDQHPEVL